MEILIKKNFKTLLDRLLLEIENKNKKIKNKKYSRMFIKIKLINKLKIQLKIKLVSAIASNYKIKTTQEFLSLRKT